MNEWPVTIRFQNLSELDTVAASLLKLGKDIPVWLFDGAMGVGKTTLIKKLCAMMGVQSMVQSPTFSLVNEYISTTGITIYHFDFYRIRSEVEALDIGIEEYFDSGGFCFIEWPEKIESLWPYPHLLIKMSLQEDEGRILEVSEVKTR
jgi:tRNA threonylcarbamoyladenosine biosynthesis protein TsaE